MTSYFMIELYKLNEKSNIILLVIPFIFSLLYFYGFYVSFNDSYSAWKYEISNLTTFTFFNFNVIDQLSISAAIFIVLFAHQLVAIDNMNWEIFNYLPVQNVLIHLSKLVLGMISTIIVCSFLLYSTHLQFAYSEDNLFEKSAKQLDYKILYFYGELSIFFIFAYSSCYLMRFKKSIWILFIASIIFFRHIFEILPGSHIYHTIRWREDLLFFEPKYLFFCSATFLLLIKTFLPKLYK